MPDESFATEQPKRIDPIWIRNFVRRRHMHFLLPFFFVWLVVWMVSWIMPVRYKSTTTILVQQPTVPQNYVTPNISVNLQTRLASLTQQILSRTRLLLIAHRLHLYESSGLTTAPDGLVSSMRKDINIALVRDPTSGNISGFTVSYSAPNPRTAQKVTSELTNLFIQNNQSSLQQESEDTTQFLQQQLAKARVSLSEQESKVKQFQSAHMGALPAQQTSNLQILGGLQSQLQNEEDSLSTARQQQVYLQSLVEQYESLHSTGQATNGQSSDLASVNAELASMTSQLAALRARYTERYPGVQELEAKIRATTRERAQLIASLKASATSSSRAHPTVNAAAISAVSATSPTVLQLKSQLESTKTEISNRQRDIAELKSRINSYQGRLNAAPAIEAQLSDLTRGYEQSQANYNDLLKKENDSAMATSMEQMQQGERFTVLDPPSLPVNPDSPNRIKLSFLGVALGLVFGLLVAGGTEFLDDRIYSDKDIEALLPVAVIGEIPEVSTEAELRMKAGKLRMGWAIAVLLIFLITTGSVFNYFDARGPAFRLNEYITNHHV